MADDDAEVIDLWPWLENEMIDRAFDAKRREAAKRRRDTDRAQFGLIIIVSPDLPNCRSVVFDKPPSDDG